MNKKCVLIGDFNCDLLQNSSVRTETFLSILPTDFTVIPKNKNYTFISFSGCTSNLDHAVFLHPPNSDLMVEVGLEVNVVIISHCPSQFPEVVFILLNLVKESQNLFILNVGIRLIRISSKRSATAYWIKFEFRFSFFSGNLGWTSLRYRLS